MEESISKMSKSLASFCNNIQSSSNALKQSLDRRPIPLDSASTTFIQSLNGRVSALSADLNLLESMTLGTVSFEELLGHCHQLYKQNQSDFSLLRTRLHSLGCLPSDDGVDELEVDFMAQSISSPGPESQLPTSHEGSTIKGLDDDSPFDDPLSLQNLGLSDICLATLAVEGDRKTDLLDSPPRLHSMDVQHQDAPSTVNTVGEDEPKLGEASKPLHVSEDDYESLPSYLKTLAPWEDVRSAVEKINSFLTKKKISNQCNFFHPEELESMGLGPKGRSYLLMLVRMKWLGVETNNGLISYRVLSIFCL